MILIMAMKLHLFKDNMIFCLNISTGANDAKKERGTYAENVKILLKYLRFNLSRHMGAKCAENFTIDIV